MLFEYLLPQFLKNISLFSSIQEWFNQEQSMMAFIHHIFYPRVQINFFFSGGVFCDAIALSCGGTAIGVSGAIVRTGHTFVLTHGVTSTNLAASYGFKLSYVQLPCGAPIDYTTTDL